MSTTGYLLVSSQSTIQVLSPTVVQDVVIASIQTQPSGVFADLWFPKDIWDGGTAATTLNDYAANIEKVRQMPQVVGATSGQSLDDSGLLQSEITFVVGYAPPDSIYPPATVDVVVPASELNPLFRFSGEPGVTKAQTAIMAAYQNLVNVASGTDTSAAATTPPPIPPTSGTGSTAAG